MKEQKFECLKWFSLRGWEFEKVQIERKGYLKASTWKETILKRFGLKGSLKGNLKGRDIVRLQLERKQFKKGLAWK